MTSRYTSLQLPLFLWAIGVLWNTVLIQGWIQKIMADTNITNIFGWGDVVRRIAV